MYNVSRKTTSHLLRPASHCYGQENAEKMLSASLGGRVCIC